MRTGWKVLFCLVVLTTLLGFVTLFYEWRVSPDKVRQDVWDWVLFFVADAFYLTAAYGYAYRKYYGPGLLWIGVFVLSLFSAIYESVSYVLSDEIDNMEKWIVTPPTVVFLLALLWMLLSYAREIDKLKAKG
ncbi:hypothetical protein [Bowmanella denitrificans]|uniref:hypothetical protein n=1 Tax=Bowmanella denitrificans TaxID=366582 RepID=UPI000C9CB2AE|nr:hypothetical protein [Bowmanella denitrificans]